MWIMEESDISKRDRPYCRRGQAPPGSQNTDSAPRTVRKFLVAILFSRSRVALALALARVALALALARIALALALARVALALVLSLSLVSLSLSLLFSCSCSRTLSHSRSRSLDAKALRYSKESSNPRSKRVPLIPSTKREDSRRNIRQGYRRMLRDFKVIYIGDSIKGTYKKRPRKRDSRRVLRR